MALFHEHKLKCMLIIGSVFYLFCLTRLITIMDNTINRKTERGNHDPVSKYSKQASSASRCNSQSTESSVASTMPKHVEGIPVDDAVHRAWHTQELITVVDRTIGNNYKKTTSMDQTLTKLSSISSAKKSLKNTNGQQSILFVALANNLLHNPKGMPILNQSMTGMS